MAKLSEARPGTKFGRLTIQRIYRQELIRPAGPRMEWIAECICDCGNIWAGAIHALGTNTKSCGCYHIHKVSRLGGLSRLYKRLYFIWHGMLDRCYKQTARAYKNYGARGIKVCDEWFDFKVFLDWALASGYEEHLTIDRKDCNADYNSINCRWLAKGVQNRNKRNTTYYVAWGERKAVVDWLDDSRCPLKDKQVINRRIRKLGWPPELAIETPHELGRVESPFLNGRVI